MPETTIVPSSAQIAPLEKPYKFKAGDRVQLRKRHWGEPKTVSFVIRTVRPFSNGVALEYVSLKNGHLYPARNVEAV